MGYLRQYKARQHSLRFKSIFFFPNFFTVLMLASASDKIMMNEVALSSGFLFPSVKISFFQRTARLTSLEPKVTSALCVKCSQKQLKLNSRADENRKVVKKSGKKEHHLWQKRDSAGSGQKALNLVRIVSELPNEKEAVYGALDKWTAWETEFPLIAAAKALKILQQRRQWTRVIQVAKWMLSKGQGATLGTYDTLLLAFDKDDRVDEAKSLWNMIIHVHTRSMSKRLFSRMISLYDHHNMQDEIIEVFADMEELGVRPDEDTVWRVARAFKKLGQEEKRELVLERYQCKWKYIHFNGERVRVKRDRWNEE
ncbi:pentatricopeptide repeat-containing protein At4g18975, chloroplastic isoform X1 [Populus nigra]|uniref:pentatricopeptide repeat-containing protein At4g18975, chloroplastic isoform X1 n=3 Tax=Populus nigra TaxID=3691 RepID=UPI002B277066|nr:pentatricopeptide repeat-containing protein At4g18975, chloroplastic isoform X1 [Populus nigra]